MDSILILLLKPFLNWLFYLFRVTKVENARHSPIKQQRKKESRKSTQTVVVAFFFPFQLWSITKWTLERATEYVVSMELRSRTHLPVDYGNEKIPVTFSCSSWKCDASMDSRHHLIAHCTTGSRANHISSHGMCPRDCDPTVNHSWFMVLGSNDEYFV